MLVKEPYIIFDPGHGGKDPGASGNGLVEKVENWDFANYLQYWMEGWLCRSKIIQPSTWTQSDGKSELYLPVSIANKEGADLFISLHNNAGGGTGFESFVKNPDSEADRIRKIIHTDCARFLKGYGVVDRGQKYKGLYVLEWTRMPAILFENFFIDSLSDAQFLANDFFMKALAYVMSEGIAKALGLKRR